MNFGLDSSVLVRLLVGEPVELVTLVRKRLLESFKNAENVHASDVVIAETYYALKYHYEQDSSAIRSAMFAMLTSGLVKPEAGSAVLEVLSAKPGGKAGFVDRLIQARYERAGLTTLTLDRAQAKLGQSEFIGK